MKLIDSKFAPSVEGINVTRFGVIYFFKDFVVTEINEGVVYGTETSEELTRLILEQYATKTNIHVISNRINNYSVSIL